MRASIISLATLLIHLLPNSSQAQGDGEKIVTAARSQIGKTLRYDSAYRSMDYPNGDVPIEVGVCTDVVIRALRTSISMDLQKLVHEDMKANFSRYPKNWGLTRTDRNIDHRRVPNLRTYLSRKGYRVPESSPPSYLPGDLVTCTVPPNLPHIMIVSDRKNESGTPLVIHNIGAGTREEDRLDQFEITGHYRIATTAAGAETAAAPDHRAHRGSTTYIVGSKADGGTLSGIARIHYGDASKWRQIHEANKELIPNPNVIRKGMRLVIPFPNAPASH